MRVQQRANKVIEGLGALSHEERLSELVLFSMETVNLPMLRNGRIWRRWSRTLPSGVPWQGKRQSAQLSYRRPHLNIKLFLGGRGCLNTGIGCPERSWSLIVVWYTSGACQPHLFCDQGYCFKTLKYGHANYSKAERWSSYLSLTTWKNL